MADVAVFARKDSERRQPLKRLAGPHRGSAHFHRVIRLAGDKRSKRSQHGNIHVLPNARSPRLVQRREHTNNRKKRDAKIRDRQPKPYRRLAFFARNIHKPAQRLNRCIQGFGRARARVAPKSANGAVHDSRIDFSHRLITNAEPVQNARTEILHDHVRLANEIGKDFASHFVFQIQRYAQFVSQAIDC